MSECAVCGTSLKLFDHDRCEFVDDGPSRRLRVLDLFAGTGSSTVAFDERGHKVVTVELDEQFDATLHADVGSLTPQRLRDDYGLFDFVWASPPCTAFSVASIGHHWEGDHRAKTPKTEFAVDAQELVRATLLLVDALAPPLGYIVENPRGILRTLPVMRGRRRSTVTYCQYGETRMKPTDLWGGVGREEWLPSRACRNGDPCHEAAPRGARTGTQGIVGARDRSRIPYELSKEVAVAVESASDRADSPDTGERMVVR